MVRIGINGMGRTGRQVLRACLAHRPDVHVVMINDLASLDLTALLVQHDSVYGRLPFDVSAKAGKLKVGDHELRVSTEPTPERIDWDAEEVDVVVEATGHFQKAEEARRHRSNSHVEHVVVCSLSPGADATVIYGVNHRDFNRGAHVISAASCTTAAASTVLAALGGHVNIEQVLLTAVHSYTNSQRLLDKAKGEDARMSRAGPMNIVPDKTGVATGLPLVIPGLQGRVLARSVRVPSMAVSMLDLCVLSASETVPMLSHDVNELLRSRSLGDLQSVLGFTSLPLVSSDFLGTRDSAVISGVDTEVSGPWIRLLAWYDHEYGYACRVADLVAWLGSQAGQ